MLEISLISIGLIGIFTEMLKILTEVTRYQLKCLRRLPKYEIYTKMFNILTKTFDIFNNGSDFDRNQCNFDHNVHDLD